MKKFIVGLLVGAALTAASLALAGTRNGTTRQQGREYQLCLASKELQKNLAYAARQANVVPPYQIYRIKSCASYIGH